MLHTDSPLRDGTFRRLFLAHVLSLMGYGLATVGLALLAYELAGASAGAVLGGAFGVKMAGKLVAAPFAGAYADRVGRKPVMMGVQLFQLLLMLFLPFVDVVWPLYLLILGMSAAESAFNPTFDASLADIFADPSRYARALSLSRAAIYVETIISPVVAAAALVVAPNDILFLFAAVCFLGSAGTVMATPVPAAPGREDRGDRLIQAVSHGYRRYFGNPELRAILTLYVAIALASAMQIVNTVVYVRDVLGLTEASVPLAMLGGGVGSILMILTVPQAVARFGDRAVMLAGGLALGPVLAFGALMPGFWGLVVLWFAVGAMLGLAMTPAGLVITRTTAPEDRTAVFAAQYALSHACWLFAYPFVGWIVTATGFPAGFLTTAALAILFALSALLIWPRSKAGHAAVPADPG